MLFSSACFWNKQQSPSETPETQSVELSASNIDLTKPLEISKKPEDLALARKIDEAIEKSEFSNARWGVFVVSLKDGRVIAARDAQKLFNPASS